MYCNRCGREIEENATYCPHCGKETAKPTIEHPIVYHQTKKKESKQWIPKLIFVLGIISIASSFVAIIDLLMIAGAIFGAITIIGWIILKLARVDMKLSSYILGAGIVGLLSNLSWLLFLWYSLPNL